MKPEEFDILLKQKFDQNDFDYNARNWDRLSAELNGPRKRRSLFVWWAPLVGVAASFAITFGFTTALNEGAGSFYRSKEQATAMVKPVEVAQPTIDVAIENTPATGNSQQVIIEEKESHKGEAKINFENVRRYNAFKTEKITAFAKAGDQEAPLASQPENKIAKRKTTQIDKPVETFRKIKTPRREGVTSLAVIGGVSYGTQSNGYAVGASARRKIGSKMFVEGDIAFINSSNYTNSSYAVTPGSGSSSTSSAVGSGSVVASRGTLVKSTGSGDATGASNEIIKTQKIEYNSAYVQITPTVGYQPIKQVAIGVGTDFQQMLNDNRPEASKYDKGNLRQAPLFDVGLMGKLEVAITSNIKAAVLYREGINNVVTPNNASVDRNYLQFQMKYSILKR